MAESTTSFWENLDAGDVWSGITDVAKVALPAALDRTGARGVVASNADKVAPMNTDGRPISGAPTKANFLASKPVLIGGAVALILLVVVMVRK